MSGLLGLGTLPVDERITALLAQSWGGNSVSDYAAALAVVLLGVVVTLLLRWALRRSLQRLADGALAGQPVRQIATPLSSLALLGAVHVAINVLRIPRGVRDDIDTALYVVAALMIAVSGLRLIAVVIDAVVRPWGRRREPPLEQQLVTVGSIAARAAFITVVVISVMNRLGLDIVSIVTGLGIGGLAVALAAQETLGNLLGSFQIITDHPYAVGDFIAVDGHQGRVEAIGMRSTKVLTATGVRVILPNKGIAAAHVENLSVHRGVTVTTALSLLYGASAEQIRQATQIVHEILDEATHVHADRKVHFLRYEAYSLALQVTYFVLDFDRLLDVQHEVNLAIKERFDAAGIGFAFPTQTMHVPDGVAIRRVPAEASPPAA